MRKLIYLLLPLLLLAGCAKSTQHGECVGVNGVKDPHLRYEYNVTNIVVGIIFVETIIVPVIVVFNELECPVERIN